MSSIYQLNKFLYDASKALLALQQIHMNHKVTRKQALAETLCESLNFFLLLPSIHSGHMGPEYSRHWSQECFIFHVWLPCAEITACHSSKLTSITLVHPTFVPLQITMWSCHVFTLVTSHHVLVSLQAIGWSCLEFAFVTGMLVTFQFLVYVLVFFWWFFKCYHAMIK